MLDDLQKAFDALDHTVLLQKMECTGFKESLNCFSHISHRFFFLLTLGVFRCWINKLWYFTRIYFRTAPVLKGEPHSNYIFLYFALIGLEWDSMTLFTKMNYFFSSSKTPISTPFAQYIYIYIYTYTHTHQKRINNYYFMLVLTVSYLTQPFSQLV